MKKVYLLLFVFLLTCSVNAQSKAEIFAKENTEKLSEILQFTETEIPRFITFLLKKKLNSTSLEKNTKGIRMQSERKLKN